MSARRSQTKSGITSKPASSTARRGLTSSEKTELTEIFALVRSIYMSPTPRAAVCAFTLQRGSQMFGSWGAFSRCVVAWLEGGLRYAAPPTCRALSLASSATGAARHPPPVTRAAGPAVRLGLIRLLGLGRAAASTPWVGLCCLQARGPGIAPAARQEDRAGLHRHCPVPRCERGPEGCPTQLSARGPLRALPRAAL